ncbi:MAG: TolC family protein [Nitrospiraceae bacterium]|nr:TolC family protein [Nitrospiraceae bacterium]
MRAALTVLLLLISWCIGGAASAAERAVTLQEALALSMTGNPQIRAMGQSVSANREDIGIAGSYLLPHLSIEERFMRTNNPAYAFSMKMNQKRFAGADLAGAPDTFNSPAPISDFQSSVSVEQALFAPKAHIGIDMAKKEAAARERDLARKKEEIALNVFRTHLGVQTAKAYVSAAEKGTEDAEAHLKVAEVRYDGGIGVYSDVLRAKVAVASAKERLVSATKNLESAKRALGLMLGLSESVDVIPEKLAPEVGPIDAYYEEALSREDLKAMEQRVRNAGNMLKMADAGYLPVVGVGGSMQANDHRQPLGAEGDSWQVMAFLRWELFDGTKREHERQKARYKMAESEEYLGGMKKEIAYQVYDAYLGVGEAHDGRELARASLQSAEEGMRIINVRYENSLASMIELIDMQTSLDASRAGLVEKEAAYLSAVANLWFQSGGIMKELGLER